MILQKTNKGILNKQNYKYTIIVILISASQVVVSKTIKHVAQPSIVRKISSQMNKMPSKPIFSSASAFVL